METHMQSQIPWIFFFFFQLVVVGLGKSLVSDVGSRLIAAQLISTDESEGSSLTVTLLDKPLNVLQLA